MRRCASAPLSHAPPGMPHSPAISSRRTYQRIVAATLQLQAAKAYPPSSLPVSVSWSWKAFPPAPPHSPPEAVSTPKAFAPSRPAQTSSRRKKAPQKPSEGQIERAFYKSAERDQLAVTLESSRAPCDLHHQPQHLHRVERQVCACALYNGAELERVEGGALQQTIKPHLEE